MTILNIYLREHLVRLQEQVGVDPLSRTFIFHRKYAKDRHVPYPDDLTRPWLSVLLRHALTPESRRALYPSRFDLGHPSGGTAEHATVSELIQHLEKESQPINEEQRSGRTSASKLRGELTRRSKRDLNTVLKGIRETTERVIDIGQSEQPLVNLKVINLLHQLTRTRSNRLFQLIDPPEHVNRTKRARHVTSHTLEFKDAYPDSRNPDATLLIADLMAYLSAEIDSIRLAQIDAATPPLPEILQMIENQNARLGRQLRGHGNGEQSQHAAAYNSLTSAIDAYTFSPQPTQSRLDETLYTYLRTLRFRHYVGGFEQTMALAVIKGTVTSIAQEMSALCDQISDRWGFRLELHDKVLSINALPDFIAQWKPELLALVECATGLTRSRNADQIKHAGKLLNLYTYFEHRTRDLNAKLLSVWDCVAALCTIRHELAVKTQYSPYWYGQKSQGNNLLMHLNAKRSIESLYQDDYVPHGVNQILYQRYNNMLSALIGIGEIHEARMAFRLSRLKQHAKILRFNDATLIRAELQRLDQYCTEKATLIRN
ncbi:hypothetical protein [Xanthomonas sp. CFBP 7912]|uniref:hypothetical protein n=1 Tax=Xanthomonas sp. CFBP 7912 TaxID=1891621 RepID=UPI001F36A603|nr:hypothetical protein [Xanthomonas sp. CFBP 7912]